MRSKYRLMAEIEELLEDGSTDDLFLILDTVATAFELEAEKYGSVWSCNSHRNKALDLALKLKLLARDVDNV